MKYRTACGKETKEYEENKGKTRNIYLQKKLIEGQPADDYKDWDMNKQCIDCKQVKTKTEEYLNVDNGTTYKCEVKYCLAKKVTLEQQLKEVKEQRNDLLQYLELIEAWEKDLLLCEECWESEYPKFNKQIYDNWMDLQQRRNTLLERITNK